VHEARKRREVPQQQETSNLKAPSLNQNRRLIKIINAQGIEEVETRVARAIYACHIPFNVV
jgi:hypothetical protein